jgi:uncharacterized membrane protein
MTRNKQKIQRLTLAAFFVTIELIMGFTPIGYIPVGALSITTMHLPVILAGIAAGPAFGAGMGFVFGLTSFLHATLEPTITSFVFSPFITIGGISGNFSSLLICFVPRIFLGWFSGMMYSILSRKFKNHTVNAMVTAVVNTLIHTLLVLGGIYVFFAPSYAQALQTSTAGVAALLIGVVSSNTVLECILAGIAVPALVKALTPSLERMGFHHGTQTAITE